MDKKVLVADDHPIVRCGIAHIVGEIPGYTVAGQASNGYELLDLVRRASYDVIVMDLSMPGLCGLDLLKHVHAVRPTIPVLILTVQPEGVDARRLLRAGAAGYLTKQCMVDQIVLALNKVCSGGRYVSPEFAEQLAFLYGDEENLPQHELLSDREFQVLQLLAEGQTPTAIADKLCVSIKTVSTYRTRILKKLGLRNNAEMMRYAMKSGLVV